MKILEFAGLGVGFFHDFAVHIRGGDRKSTCHDDRLKLKELEFDYNQSSRWQREATVPAEVFEQYLATANELGNEITAQGLLRLQRMLRRRKRRASSYSDLIDVQVNGRNAERSFHNGNGKSSRFNEASDINSARELFDEIKNHRNLLEQILAPICGGTITDFALSERQITLRLLKEIQDLLVDLEQLLVEV